MIVERSVVLSAADCRLIVGALIDAEARAGRNGRRLDDRTRQIVREVAAVAGSPVSLPVAGPRPAGTPSVSSVRVTSYPADGPFLSSGRVLRVAAAAELAGVTRRRIAQLGRRGSIRRARVDGRWVYDEKGVEEYARSRGA